MWKENGFLCHRYKGDLLDVLLGLFYLKMKVEGKSFVWQFATWEAEGGYPRDHLQRVQRAYSTFVSRCYSWP